MDPVAIDGMVPLCASDVWFWKREEDPLERAVDAEDDAKWLAQHDAKLADAPGERKWREMVGEREEARTKQGP